MYLVSGKNRARADKKRNQRLQTGATAALAEAKVFMTGRSQAVRLPLEYRVSGSSVYVKRLGNAIVLMPKTGDRWSGLFAALDEFPRDFKLQRKQNQARRIGLNTLLDWAKE